MNSESLADQIINISASPAGEFDRDDPRTWVNRILEVSPSVYTHQGFLVHEHEIIERGNREQIMALLRDPDVSVTSSRAIWIYDELLSAVPELSYRFIQVSDEYMWDAEYCRLLPVSCFSGCVAQSDNITKKMKKGN